ncbi:ExbD/TolR family protein [Haliangium ochraceum]|uniref:Biopolymer transport protein ExbD/TolR n=1 Tax=Haliangium ochraceum (strain DSM 14365 / JCM 11303 / SMP-2) TaxID=502025 RepID=D0LY01_HALO1|nr:biopolymer transporter ExbD [Haliangium ochraceum]ACY14356.1 Biopolymer transport protein ExbD/TolR [Haliangium ochraceum DSM 14365]
MGAAIETGDDKKSVDVHLNIVPFIDLMSCLTAFLLVTAVWTNIAQISIKPKGVGRVTQENLDVEETIRASILIQESTIWVGLSTIGDFRQIKRDGEEYNWPALREVLEEHKEAHFSDREDIEVAAEDDITYQSIISVMDVAIDSGFKDVGLADPASLSARPQL